MKEKFNEQSISQEDKGENQNKHLLTDVERIHESRAQVIKTKEEIAKYVERPLLKACEALWDRGIRTLESSANKEDHKARGYAYIVVDYGSLSDENKKIVDQSEDIDDLSDYDGLTKAFVLKIPFESIDMDQEKIAQKALELASRFHKQPAIWVPRILLKELKERYSYEPNEKVDPQIFVWEEGFYYDKKENIFYLSEEHYKLFHQNRE